MPIPTPAPPTSLLTLLVVVEAAANKATPGPWRLHPLEHDDWGCVRDAAGKPVANVMMYAQVEGGFAGMDAFRATNHYGTPAYKRGPEQVARNGEYVAAANPATVLTLCGALRTALGALQDISMLAGDSSTKYCAARALARAALSAAPEKGADADA